MLLHTLVTTSLAVRSTRSRKQKIAHLADLLRTLAGDEIEVGVSYLAGEIPGGRVSVGPALLRDSRPGTSSEEPTLELLEVQKELRSLATIEGKGSKKLKTERLGGLLARGSEEEQQFLAHLVIGELRQGALAGLMADAIAAAAEVPADQVRRATMFAGELGPVAVAAFEEGAAGLDQFDLQLFRPIQPMLAQTAQDPADALERLEQCELEYKLDGARVQVHKSGDKVRVFSRRLNDVTAAVPEIVERAKQLPAEEIVLDGETIALKDDGRPHPFQTTMRRFGRKKNVDELRDKLPLDVFYFDILRLDRQTLIDAPTTDRVEALNSIIPADDLVPRTRVSNQEEADAFLEASLEGGHEGIMAKALDAPYEAGGRGYTWLKIKLAHTLDLVVLGCEWGSGRRQGRLSNLHLGARDPKTGGFIMLGKTFKGMTDEILRWQTNKLQEIAVGRDEYTVYVRPELVVEIACNELQASPHYPGGLALRFARLKRYRPDKKAEDADTIDTVRAIHAGEVIAKKRED